MVTAPDLIVSALVGLAAGFTSGLFGVGGGVLMVPAVLYLVPGTTFHVAKAASLLAMSFSSVVGVLRHRKHGNVDVRTGLVLGAAGLVGAAVGVVVAEGYSDRALRIAFGLLLIATGLRLSAGRQPDARPWAEPGRTAFTLGVGFIAGILAGFFGIGGGIVMVPALALSGVAIHLAVGTSLVAVLVNAWAATATNLVLGYGGVILAIGLPTAAGGLVGALLGADVANRLPAKRLRGAFGFSLVLVGIGMALDGWFQ